MGSTVGSQQEVGSSQSKDVQLVGLAVNVTVNVSVLAL